MTSPHEGRLPEEAATTVLAFGVRSRGKEGLARSAWSQSLSSAAWTWWWQEPRQLIGLCVELGVRACQTLVYDSDRIGRPLYLFFEQLVNESVGRGLL
jgi:hypothetical protein